MAQLVYTEEELMQSHAYARPQVEAGMRLHGGFDSDDRYIPPPQRQQLARLVGRWHLEFGELFAFES